MISSLSFKTYMKISLHFLILLILSISCSAQSFEHFVTTDKDKLMDGDRELRFVSFNIPNLHYIEDYLAFDSSNPWRLPDEFEIRDALKTIKELGGKVTRTYVLSVRKQGESKRIIRHVIAPGVFNEDAFKALDKVMQIANEIGVRVIIPLVDNWWWWGGPTEYAAFRNKTRDEFWTDPQLISDFKKTIDFIVNRRNSYTGTLYKEDKALLGWETGNELVCPYDWTAKIAKYIKSLDKNHIVIEGTHSQIISDESINDPNIDVLSTHHYTPVDEAIKNILQNKKLTKNKKPYFVGEFGLTSPANVKAIVDSTMNNDVSGIMIWSLRFHNRDGGFYMHRENNGNGPFRFPGFKSGEVYGEKEIINLLRNKAFGIDSLPAPPIDIPDAPVLLDIKDTYSISWQGSVGASSYIIERREVNADSWTTIADSIIDADNAYKPLFEDTSAHLGKEYYYRVIAQNESGLSEPSNEIGPVKVTYYKIVDELEDDSKIFGKEGIVEPIRFKDIYQVKEDHSRMEVSAGSSVIYKVPENILSFKIFVFTKDNVCNVKLFAGDSLYNFAELTTKLETFTPYKNVYGFLIPFSVFCEEFPENTKYVKIFFEDESQLSRTEIEYSGD